MAFGSKFTLFSPNNWYELILGILTLVILEEFTFRLYLSNQRKKNWHKIFVGLVSIALFSFVFYDSYYVLLIIPLIFSISLNWIKVNHSKLNIINTQIILSTFLFACIHLSSYNIKDYSSISVIIIAFISHSGAGLLYGYLKVRYNILIPIVLHLFWNSSIFFMNAGLIDTNKKILENDNLKIEISENWYYESPLYNVSEDTIKLKNTSIIKGLGFVITNQEMIPNFKPEHNVNLDKETTLLLNHKQNKQIRSYDIKIIKKQVYQFQEIINLLKKEDLLMEK